jgi:hypothetical protein
MPFRSPGVYAWESKEVSFESPINGALISPGFLTPGVNAWARENFKMKLAHHPKLVRWVIHN